jgi:hypothetical protein
MVLIIGGSFLRAGSRIAFIANVGEMALTQVNRRGAAPLHRCGDLAYAQQREPKIARESA